MSPGSCKPLLVDDSIFVASRLPLRRHPSSIGKMAARVLVTQLVLAATWVAAAEEWVEFPGGRSRALTVPSQGRTGFVLLSPSETGVNFTNVLRDADGAINRTFFNGSGVAAGDVDGDGRPDLVLAGLEGRLELYRNLGAGRFTNVTTGSGLVATNAPNRGVVLADLNGDGAPDLLLSTMGGGIRWFRNLGGGRFGDGLTMGETASRQGSMTLALADVDGNGTVDVYVTNNRFDDIRDRGEVQLRLINGRPAIPPSLTNRLTLLDGQVLEYGEPDRLLTNDGTGQFRDVSWTDGRFRDEFGNPVGGPPLDWGLSVTFRDLNGDGAPDLYVCNDFWTPDRVWINDGRGIFQALSTSALRQISGSSMGVDLADLNEDGRPEIFVVDMLSRDLAWRKQQREAQTESPAVPGVFTNQPQTLRNTLFLAQSDGSYRELAAFAGVAASEWSWQPVFLDVDLDGRPDLLITSGHARDVQDRDAEAAVEARERDRKGIADPAERRRQIAHDRLANLQLYPRLNTPVVAFRNEGELRFRDVTSEWGTGRPAVYHGIATADFDGDGDLDLAINVLNGPAALFRNESTAPRIAVRLKGRTPNTEALGAVVTLRAPGRPVQRQEVIGGGRYLSGSDPLLVFAAGTNREPATLEVRWRDGTRRVIEGIQANREYEIRQEAGLDTAPPPPPVPAVEPWFEDRSALLQHRHTENTADDFGRQPLLPRRLSQSGPGVVWADWDGDGRDDLALGSGTGGRLAVFRNDPTGSFTPLAWPGLESSVVTDLLGIVPVPAGSGQHLLAALDRHAAPPGMSNVLAEFGPTPTPAQSDGRLPPEGFGPLALADFDGDGDLDLFAGGRARTGRYPEGGPSRILRREGERWVVDEANSQVVADSGSVNGAVWSDLDGDGFAELVLACEWGPIRIFRNERGTLKPWNPALVGGDQKSLEDLTGRWNGVTAGDFDGDGRLDLVATNWGENREDALPGRSPAWLIAVDGPGDGRLALVEAAWDHQRQALTPIRSLPELAEGMPWLVGQFHSFRAFSEATLSEVLGPQEPDSRRFEANILATILLLNRGDRFELRRLPDEAQWTPALAAVVADFDGDGAEDLFLSQNFFALRPGLPRRDAGQGLWLRGDGRGGLIPQPARLSGLNILGEQRGAATADFDRDGRPDLIVTQNGAETRLFRNRRGQPGLRVKLAGPPGNPTGIGAVVQLIHGAGHGPARELHAGAGYLSTDAPTIVLARPKGTGDAMHLRVRWPGGQVTEAEAAGGEAEIRVESPR